VAKFGYEVEQYFGHSLDVLLDLGGEVSGEESTILDMSQGLVSLVREGAGPTDQIDITEDESSL
jgi:tRNA A37 threonylcarbamoyladenosine synthetase subunit TsaC/SUA5/YrdC